MVGRLVVVGEKVRRPKETPLGYVNTLALSTAVQIDSRHCVSATRSEQERGSLGRLPSVANAPDGFLSFARNKPPALGSFKERGGLTLVRARSARLCPASAGPFARGKMFPALMPKMRATQKRLAVTERAGAV